MIEKIIKVFEDRNGDVLYYIYSGDDLLGFIYKDVTYYYHKNIFGDIIGILDANYNEIVTYTYDTFGVIKSIIDNSNLNLGVINPFRYRSYYYDEETKLYYLNSRYYNPLWGRFISSDRIMASNENVSSCNLFGYASNNFLNNIDKNGMWGENFKKFSESLTAKFKKKSIKKASQSNKVSLTLASSAFLLGIKKYPITSVLFNKAMWDPDSKLDDTTEKMIQNSLMESDTFREGVDSIIERNYKYNQSFTSNIEHITFRSGDLKYAFHEADIRVSCTWSNGYPTYLVTFSDTYDFTEYYENPKGLGEYANNLGYEMQKNGQLKPYNISMTFEYR